MERWLSKSRVLLGLCGVLLLAALNSQDSMVYAMFLFIMVVSVLGYLLPWLSLRFTSVRLDAQANLEVMEGLGCNINIFLERTAWWPAFMVNVETEWEWASQRKVLSQIVPVVRAGRTAAVGRHIQFPCRGYYELVAVRLSSGFPLGLTHAHHALARPQIQMRVLPQVQPVQWPLPWDIAEDPQGELTTRRMGQSYELGMLRNYQQGESVGRVSWRASARVGELVIQHFQQSGSVRLRVVVQVPHGASLGDAMGSGEQAIRLAAGVCHAALENSAQLFLYVEHKAAPVSEVADIYQALSEAVPSGGGLAPLMERAASDTAPGEQIAVVVSATCPGSKLLMALGPLTSKACRIIVCIALGRRVDESERAQAQTLQHALQQAGFATLMEAP